MPESCTNRMNRNAARARLSDFCLLKAVAPSQDECSLGAATVLDTLGHWRDYDEPPRQRGAGDGWCEARARRRRW